MNKVFAFVLMIMLGALGFILHCVQGVLMLAWMIRHPSRWLDDGYSDVAVDWVEKHIDRPPLSWIENATNYVTRNLFNKSA
ncbi:hypothetical protein 101114BS4_057 [Escherichia phage vB_EcoS-101114BS4]|uniref:Uncharacterized protein n=1 Tax=Escherichia phage vB_EcoS-101114BS4 TaxID=2865793 RepID=A0AAE8C6B0_9CAUD|nr:hypothetical protein P9606_gp57 [Escherichia phage vB_EcoS-101114BS4]QZI78421.1 hypothetical protein 22664B1_062 [Escherichia phage vB_EcoS-22664B1]QZI79051.1 hypothetical protein 101114B2_061 [Escherichia phage vB_EcoS-101114B2]QZI79117.1 hypothetical protein 101114BS4_057 [Escherichia phage vB_EcoS-101114BS4]